MAKKTIVVFGATDRQGGSAAKYILVDPKAASHFHVKAVSRDPAKAMDSVKALAFLGAEVVVVSLTLKQPAGCDLSTSHANH